MKVLSLFDGISCARVALKMAGIQVDEYFSSEIDEPAIKIAQDNFPDTIQVGDIRNLAVSGNILLWSANGENYNSGLKKFDLMIGGSPCQDLSIANNKRAGLKGKRSGLFYEYVRLLKALKPKYFILENVASMSRDSQYFITKELGVEPVMIDAALVSAQRRKRLFWTNIPICVPDDKYIYLRDILQDDKEVDEKYYISDEVLRGIMKSMRAGKPLPQSLRIHDIDHKSVTLNALGGGAGAKTGLYFINSKKNKVMVVPEATAQGFAVARDGDAVDFSFPASKTRRGRVGGKVKTLMTSQTISVFKNGRVRRLTPIECERLQCLPDLYTDGASDSQRYKMTGNAFNVEVVRHILKHLKV